LPIHLAVHPIWAGWLVWLAGWWGMAGMVIFLSLFFDDPYHSLWSF